MKGNYRHKKIGITYLVKALGVVRLFLVMRFKQRPEIILEVPR